MIYHQNILKREDKELVKRIYKAQVENPVPGDLSELLKADYEMIEEAIDEIAIVNTSVSSYKKFIKSKVKNAALRHLNQLKESHSKVKHIEYKGLETQPYLTSPLFTNDDVSLLFSLRSRYVECKANFKNKHSDLLCPFCMTDEDSQQHMLECQSLKPLLQSSEVAEDKIEYGDLFRNSKKQKAITNLFKHILEARNKLK